MTEGNLFIEPVFSAGPLVVTGTVVTTWAIMAAIWLFSWLISHRLRIDPGPVQTATEGIVTIIEDAVTAVAPLHARRMPQF